MNGDMGMVMGMNNSMGQLYGDFRASFNEALLYATMAAMFAAFILSLFFSRSVIAPVHAMSLATQRIADGRYDERVQVSGNDELAQLAVSFNQMAEKLNQVEAMRRRLIGDVSHELRTPLTAIKGSMEGLMDGILPATEETFQQVHTEAERLNRLVNDLQELSRVEARAYQLDIRPVDVSTLVRTVTKRLSSQAESKRIILDSELAPDLLHVLADEDRAVQVLTNLAGNALQYTPEGGRVTISVKRISNEVQISIRDTGIGIPTEKLDKLFRPFTQVDPSATRRYGGTGLGLVICKHFAQILEGDINVESQEGKGSTFTVKLPERLLATSPDRIETNGQIVLTSEVKNEPIDPPG